MDKEPNLFECPDERYDPYTGEMLQRFDTQVINSTDIKPEIIIPELPREQIIFASEIARYE